MTPRQLLDLCLENIREWAEHPFTDEPTVMLVLPRKTAPMGESIKLYGRAGPKGRIANIRETETGYDVVAYFPAIPIALEVAEHLGIKIKIMSKEELPDEASFGKEKHV